MLIYDTLPASLAGLAGIPADGSVPVASGGSLAYLPKSSAKGRFLRTGPVTGNLGYYDSSTVRPEDFGFLGWSQDPAEAHGNLTAITPAGTIFTSAVKVPESGLATGLLMHIGVAGSALTAGQCLAAIYDPATWTLLATSADQAAAWASSGSKTMPFAGGPVQTSAPFVIAAYFFNGTTGPNFRGGNNAAMFSGLPPGGTFYRYGLANTGRTTMPATLTTPGPGSPGSIWVAIY